MQRDHDLRIHALDCQNPKCACSRAVRCATEWFRSTPIAEGSADSWLRLHVPEPGGAVTWSCVLCHSSQPNAATRHGENHAWLKRATFARHQETLVHKRAAAARAHAPPPSARAPAREVFRAVLREHQRGVAVRTQGLGPPFLVKADKVARILWCLGEAARALLGDKLRAATVANLLRDERHSRLHIRIRCVAPNGQVSAAYLGQGRAGGQTALDIRRATEQVIRRACTAFASPPPGCQVEPQFDAELFAQICSAIEAVTIDSASNETAAGGDAYQAVRGAPPLLPNCRFTLHDSAHKARRLLSRPWAASAELGTVIQLFVTDRDSISQLVHHSYELKHLYHRCCSETAGGDEYADAAVETCFGNLRSAKHRIESLVTPLSRLILNISGAMLFATRLNLRRRGEREGIAAAAFLQSLDARVLVVAAMMADAGQESLLLIRAMDAEDMSTADVNSSVARFLDRIAWLFHMDGCLTIPGHTHYIIDWLQQRHFVLIDTAGHCIGGEPVGRAALDDAFQHMRVWVHLAKQVLAAEFPEFDLINSFSVFGLREDAPPSYVDVRLRRLAKTFRVPGFPTEFRTHWHDARRAHQQAGLRKPCAQPWFAALAANPAQLPADALRTILLRYACFAASTSKVEQSFSKIANALGAVRLNAEAESEERSIALLLFDAAALGCGEEDLFEKAAAVWAVAFPGARQHSAPRADIGNIPAAAAQPAAPPGARLSETQFLKRSHAAVAAGTPAGAADVLSLYEPGRSDACVHEEAFQAQKRQKRFIEANLAGALLEEEVSEDLARNSAAAADRQMGSLRARIRRADHLEAVDHSVCSVEAVFPPGSAIFVDDGLPLPQEWDVLLARRQLRQVRDLAAAAVLVAKDPWRPGGRCLSWAAALRGLWVASPAVLGGARGPALKHQRALRTRRHLWASAAFRESCPDIWATILEAMLAHDGPCNWSLLPSPEAWAVAKALAVEHSRSAEVLALLTEAEVGAMARTPHAFGPAGFLEFVARPDLEMSCLGLGRM